MVLLERVGLLAQSHGHDDPTGGFLNAGTPPPAPQGRWTVLFPKTYSQSSSRHSCTLSPLPPQTDTCSTGPQIRALCTSPLTPAALEEPKHNPESSPCDLVEHLCEDEFMLANETDDVQTLLSQPRMLCASSSVNNWKTEHLGYRVEIILEVHSSKHCLWTV